MDDLSRIVKKCVQDRLVQAQELEQDARIIQRAWEQGDLETLVALEVLAPEEAKKLTEGTER
jgi:hypothetical protein